MKSKDFIREDAGATCSSAVATVVPPLGEKGALTKKEINKRLSGYTNQLTPGGIIKGVKQAKVK